MAVMGKSHRGFVYALDSYEVFLFSLYK